MCKFKSREIVAAEPSRQISHLLTANQELWIVVDTESLLIRLSRNVLKQKKKT